MVGKISPEQLLTSLLTQRVEKDENNGEKININYFDEFFFQKVSLKEIKKLFETLNAALPDEAQLKRLGEKMVLEYRANARITQDPLDVLTKDNDKKKMKLLIKNHCRNKLESYKVPVKIKFIESLEHTQRFKKK